MLVEHEDTGIQGPAASAPPPAFGRQQLLERLTALFDRRTAGDIDGMMEFVAPDIVCFPPTTWGYARYPIAIRGREAVREVFKQRHINYVNLMSKVNRVLVDGDQVVVHRSTEIRERGAATSYTFDCIDFIRFRDGLIVEFQELPDGSAYDAVINFPH